MVVDLKRGSMVLLLAAALPAWSQTAGALPDPTKPAPAFSSPVDTAATQGAAVSRLSSVMLPQRGGRANAVIDGQLLRVGEKLGEATLVRVTESTAILEGPAGRETLYLTPDVTKTPAVTKTPIVSRTVGRASAKEKR